MKRICGALAAFAVLTAAAARLLHGTVLYAVLALFAGLALKTVIADKAGWTSRSDNPDSARPPETDSDSQHTG